MIIGYSVLWSYTRAGESEDMDYKSTHWEGRATHRLSIYKKLCLHPDLAWHNL